MQQREEHRVIADLVGKAGHVRTVPIQGWVKAAVDAWTTAAAITHGRVFRSINKAGRVWGDGMTPKVIWEIVRAAAARAGIEKPAPHDLRRTCARLCHLAGGELDQFQFLLGHVSIQTTERYLGVQAEVAMRRQRYPRDRARIWRVMLRPGRDREFVRPARLLESYFEPAIAGCFHTGRTIRLSEDIPERGSGSGGSFGQGLSR